MHIDLENVIIESGSAEEFNTEKNENTEQNIRLDKSTDDSADNKDTDIPVSEDTTEEHEEKVVEEVVEENTESIISEIKNHFGYEVEGEFSEDIEGLKTLTTEIAKKIALEEFQQVFEAYPDVAEYMQFRMNGGDPDKFLDLNKNIDYSTIQLDEDNLNQSKEIISTFLRKQGFTDEDIRDTISDYEDTGILAKQAKKILPKLQDLSTKEKQSILEQHEKQRQAEIEETREHWKNIRSTIDSGKVKNIAIPEADKKKFFDWMALPKENNKSQRDIDREKMSLDDMIALEYLIYKGLDISKLAIAKQNTQETERLKSLLGSKGNKIKGTPSSAKKTFREVGKLEEYIF